MPSNAVEDIDFGDESISDDKASKYKGVQGQTDRIGLILTEKFKLKKAKSHFMFGQYVLCKSGLCCELAPKPSEFRIGAVVIQYATTKNGELKKPFSYELKPWVFSEKKFLSLKRVNEEWKLEEHDLKVLCKEAQYQQLEFTACKESLWQKNDKLKAEVLAAIPGVMKQVWLGKDLTPDELKELAGMASEGVEAAEGGTTAKADVSDEDYNDILENL